MSRKQFKLLEGEDDTKAHDYENRDELHGVIKKKNFEMVNAVNKSTIDILGEEWIDNIKINKKLWRKHEKIRGMTGLGRNKAVIGIGAGPSFHKNKQILKDVVIPDGLKSWEDREFITIAANHQFKPILNMGIIPDFVLLVDASDSLEDQLITDIPKSAHGTQLITGPHANSKLLRKWDKSGRGIVFYSTPSDIIQDASKKYNLRNCNENKIELGGNVLNGAFMIGCAVLQSTIFMGVGNDLSFPIKDDVEDQRSSYYADGDYSTNIATERDEGGSPKRWAGYSMERKRVITLNEPIGCKARYNFELDIVGTSHTLWVYKTWLETIMMGQTSTPVYLHYFNCSESGILGVMAKEETDEALKSADNWYFLDEVCINKHTGRQMYMTAMLEDAIKIFLKARRSQTWGHRNDAQYATGGAAAN